jgi:hypothetical protein
MSTDEAEGEFDLSRLSDTPGHRLVNRVAGSSEGDNLRHLIVRAEFLRLLHQDERVQALHTKWAVGIGFLIPHLRLVESLRSLATLTGLGDWRRVPGSPIDPARSGDPRRTEELVEVANEALLAFCSVRWNHEEIMDEACQFVTNLGLPWLWLVLWLVDTFNLKIVAMSEWGSVETTLSIRRPDLPPPPCEATFLAEPGETLSNIRRRFNEELDRWRQQVAESDMPRGKRPGRTEEETLKTYAAWFYRKEVKGESVRSIARDVFGKEQDRRKDIYDGLDRARKLLDLAAYSSAGLPNLPR